MGSYKMKVYQLYRPWAALEVDVAECDRDDKFEMNELRILLRNIRWASYSFLPGVFKKCL